MAQVRINNVAGRGLVALIATLALLLALAVVPAGLAVSHGPGALAASPVAGADHGHDHAWGETDATQHDATDHEHPAAAILPGSGQTDFDVPGIRLYSAGQTAFSHSRDGPRRPPRAGMT